ncbi:serine protease inhibitor Cvsi-2-like [Dreissena polymorpha]|uniref:Uncharacterized protein n=1 Tax=Dreissena polymorpha TaxID=45954 RepID=A0A9D4EUF9_DREPO|nr:serine protease inhibitor Cvsi-2-like [Dreissena polymorpha]KAH3785971.1 hypothetical protein DPMN_164067 [Dreissena polymorpha]
MKIVAYFATVCFVSLVTGEDCPHNNATSDCSHMVCAAGFHKECIRNVCTCSVNHACATKSDCVGITDIKCLREWHCVDARCLCYGDIGG